MALKRLVAALTWRGRVLQPDSGSAWAWAFAVVLFAALAFPLLSKLSGVVLPPFITFYPAVVIAALAGGPRIGIAAALVSLAVAWYFFVDGPQHLLSRPIVTPFFIYLVTSTFIGWTVGQSRLALDRAVIVEQMRTNAARESVHRTKNLLAVVQAIVRKVYRETETKEQFHTVLNSRLNALGIAQDVLIQMEWNDVPVARMVTSALAPFLPNPGLKVQPGPNIMVPAKHVPGLCMALFELATNSMKYGALAEGRGPVFLSWRHDDVFAVLEWREEAAISTSRPEGFGVKLIRAALGAENRASVNYERDSKGIVAAFRWVDPRIR